MNWLIALEVFLSLIGLWTWRIIWQVSYPERYAPIPIPQYIDDLPVTQNSIRHTGGYL